MTDRWATGTSDDPRLACITDLPRRGGRRGPEVVLEGEATVRRAIAAGHPVRLCVATPACAARIADLPGIERGLTLTEAELSRMVGYPFHRGCIGVVDRPTSPSLQGEIERVAALPRARVVALDRIADAENVGAILRTARALGVDLVLVGSGCADPWSRRALRSSMGHALAQPLVTDVDLSVAIAEGPSSLEWWATDAEGDRTTLAIGRAPDAPAKLGVVFGNEGDGVAPAIAIRCARRIAIPTVAAAESLNVAAAAAIVLWALGATSDDVHHDAQGTESGG